MWRAFKQLKRSEGQAIVILAGAMALIMVLAATVIDVGTLMVTRHRLQDVSDLAALAAVHDLPDQARARATALAYAAKNAPARTVSVSFPDPQTVVVSTAGVVTYGFARALGFSTGNVQANGGAAPEVFGGALNYTLFSGSRIQELQTNGQNIYVGGDSHTNKNFVANGQKITITGVCEAVTTITQTGAQLDIKKPRPNSPYVPMPDFADLVKAQAQKKGAYYVGNKIWNGTQITVDTAIYVEGNITINGAKFTGKGTIVASGNITFNGSGSRVNAADAFAFYAKNGGITMNGSNLTIDGILYAPNGNIFLDGNNMKVNGRVIGNTVGMNGADFTIKSSANDLIALPFKSYKLVR